MNKIERLRMSNNEKGTWMGLYGAVATALCIGLIVYVAFLKGAQQNQEVVAKTHNGADPAQKEVVTETKDEEEKEEDQQPTDPKPDTASTPTTQADNPPASAPAPATNAAIQPPDHQAVYPDPIAAPVPTPVAQVSTLTVEDVQKIVREEMNQNPGGITPANFQEVVNAITAAAEKNNLSQAETAKQVKIMANRLESLTKVLEDKATPITRTAQFDPADPLGLNRIEALDRESAERKAVLGKTLKDALRIAGIKTLTQDEHNELIRFMDEEEFREARLQKVERIQGWYNNMYPARPFPSHEEMERERRRLRREWKELESCPPQIRMEEAPAPVSSGPGFPPLPQ